MKKLAFGIAALWALSFGAVDAAAKTKKTKKPAASVTALAPLVAIYDPADPTGQATFTKIDEPLVPEAPLMAVTTDKEAGKGVAEERSVGIEKGKKAK